MRVKEYTFLWILSNGHLVHATLAIEMFRQKPYRSKAYLSWAKFQYRKCCVCGENYGSELHHFGDKGMGQKASDLLVCRVCPGCHQQVQGKRVIAFRRLRQLETWIDIQADAIALLTAYIEYLEQRVGHD